MLVPQVTGNCKSILKETGIFQIGEKLKEERAGCSAGTGVQGSNVVCAAQGKGFMFY